MSHDAAEVPGRRFADARRHPRLWRWVVFDPPLRDARVSPNTRRLVSCRVCGVGLGMAGDPIDALLVAWRRRHHLDERPGMAEQSRRRSSDDHLGAG